MSTSSNGPAKKSVTPTPDTAIAEFEQVLHDAQALVEATGDLASKNVVELREKLSEQLTQVRSSMGKVETRVRSQAHGVDEYVHASPWQAVGIAAGVGLVVGLLVGRR